MAVHSSFLCFKLLIFAFARLHLLILLSYHTSPKLSIPLCLKMPLFLGHFCSSLKKRQLVLLFDVFSRRIEPFVRDCRWEWAEAEHISARAGESVYCYSQHLGHFDLSPLLCSVFVRLDLIPFGHHRALNRNPRLFSELCDDLVAPFLV